jgi:hypothetical protein
VHERLYIKFQTLQHIFGYICLAKTACGRILHCREHNACLRGSSFSGGPGRRSRSVERSLRSLSRNPLKTSLAQKDRGPSFWGRSLRTLSTMPYLGGHQQCLQAAQGAEATTRTLSCLPVCCVEPSCIAIFMPGYVNLIPHIHDSHRASSMSGQRHRHGCGFSNRTWSP